MSELYLVVHHPDHRVARSCGRVLLYTHWRDAGAAALQWTLADSPLDPHGYWYFRRATREECRALAVTLDCALTLEGRQP